MSSAIGGLSAVVLSQEGLMRCLAIGRAHLAFEHESDCSWLMRWTGTQSAGMRPLDALFHSRRKQAVA